MAGGTAGGRQRTDSTHVLAKIRALNRAECVVETLRHALNVLAVAAPDWLHGQVEPDWLERYGPRADEYRFPSGEDKRQQFLHQVGRASHSRVHTGPEGWRLPERPLSEAVADDWPPTAGKPQEKEADKIKYWFSVLPQDSSLSRLVLLAHARWVIEQFYEDAKQECGFDHDQGRSWKGLHRHLALVMLASSFLMLSRFTLPLPAGEAFPPLGDTQLAAFRASAGVPLAVPGSLPLAPPD